MVLVRNAVWRVVQGVARKDARRVEELVADSDVEALREAIATYFEAHVRVHVDPTARSPKLMKVEREDGPTPARWVIHQVLSDPEEHNDWQLTLQVDLAASRESGEVELRHAVVEQL